MVFCQGLVLQNGNISGDILIKTRMTYSLQGSPMWGDGGYPPPPKFVENPPSKLKIPLPLLKTFLSLSSLFLHKISLFHECNCFMSSKNDNRSILMIHFLFWSFLKKKKPHPPTRDFKNPPPTGRDLMENPGVYKYFNLSRMPLLSLGK